MDLNQTLSLASSALYACASDMQKDKRIEHVCPTIFFKLPHLKRYPPNILLVSQPLQFLACCSPYAFNNRDRFTHKHTMRSMNPIHALKSSRADLSSLCNHPLLRHWRKSIIIGANQIGRRNCLPTCVFNSGSREVLWAWHNTSCMLFCRCIINIIVEYVLRINSYCVIAL